MCTYFAQSLSRSNALQAHGQNDPKGDRQCGRDWSLSRKPCGLPVSFWSLSGSSLSLGWSATLKGLSDGVSGLKGVAIDRKGATIVGDRFLRVWLSLLTALWVVTFVAVFGLIRSESLRVSRVELVNSKGKVVAVLGIAPNDGGVLLLYDANGTLRVGIGMTTEGNAALDLNDSSGNQRVIIQVNADGKVSAKGLRVR